MVTTVSKYYKDLEKIPVVNSPRSGFLKEAMPNMFSRSPRRSVDLVDEYYGKCIHNSTHWQSPQFYAFFSWNIVPATVVGEMSMVGLNENNKSKSEPVDRLNIKYEEKALDWIADMLKLPSWYSRKKGAQSAIYSSAGDSFLNVALAAKNRQRLQFPDENLVDKQVGYMSIVSNSAVERSIKFWNLILNYIKDSKRSQLIDDFPIISEELEAMFESDVRKGLKPTIYILTLGSTNSLSIESIKEASKAWRKYNVWLHVDAAYLGIYAVVPELRHCIDDIELADSFSTNGSKSLWCGMGSNLFYCVHKNYKKWLCYGSEPTLDGPTRFSIDDNSTMHMTWVTQTNARRIVTTLLSLGKKKIIKEFRRHFKLADYFRELISRERIFELIQTKNRLNLVMFRLRGRNNQENAEFLDKVMDSGRIFLVLSTVHDITFLRMSIGTMTTTKDSIREAADHIISVGYDFISLPETMGTYETLETINDE